MISLMKCQIMMHNQQQIVGVCQSLKCKMPQRLVCFKCIQLHLKDGQCQIQDIKDEQELTAIIKDYISGIDIQYDNSIIYCQTQKIIKIKELQKYLEQWQDGYKKLDYLESTIKQIKQDQSSLKLEAYLQDNYSQYTLDQYLKNSIAQFTKLKKYMNGHPNFMIDFESKLQQSEQLDSIQDQLSKLNEKAQQDLQMNEEEILFFLKNKQEYQINNEKILQYQLATTYHWNEVLIKDDEKNFYQLKLEYLKNNMIQGKLKIGLLDELLEFYKQIIRKLPKSLQVLENIAKIYIQKRQYSYALQYYNKCIQINPFEYRFYHNKAQILYNNLNYVSDALICYEKFCIIDNTNYSANIQRAQIYQKQNNHLRALECYSAYIKIDPNYHKKQQFLKAYQDCCDQSIKYDKTNHKINYITYIKKCQSHILQKDFKIALKLFNEYMKLDKNYFKKADLVNAILECCNQFINFDKTYMIAYMTKSNVLCQKKQYLASISCYENYIKTNKNNLQNVYFLSILQCCDLYIDSDKQNYLPYLKKAQILKEQKDIQAAIKSYEQYMQINVNYNQIVEFFQALLQCCDLFIDSDKQNHLPYIKKAQILQQKKDFQAAFQCYDQYIILNNNYQKNEFYQALIECCDQYIKNDIKNPLAYVKKAQIQQQMKDFQAAVQCFDYQYRKINVDYYQNIQFLEAFIKCCDQLIKNEQKNHMPYIKKAQILEEKKDYEAALQCYEQFLNIATEQSQHKDQVLSKFIKCCDQYIAHNKLNHIPYLKKAQMFRKTGKNQQAFDCYQLCINNSNNKYEAMLNQGIILKENNQYKEAKTYFEKCIEIDPTKNDAKQFKKQIEQEQEKGCVIF